MKHTLHLTSVERKIFEALPADLQAFAESSLEDETIDAYETEDVLRARLSIFPFEQFPQLKTVAETLLKTKKDKELAALRLPEIPANSLPSFLFLIGARGMSALLGTMLSSATTAEDLENAAALSKARHQLLAINSSSAYVS